MHRGQLDAIRDARDSDPLLSGNWGHCDGVAPDRNTPVEDIFHLFRVSKSNVQAGATHVLDATDRLNEFFLRDHLEEILVNLRHR